MQVTVTIETAHGYGQIASQLRDLANKFEGKAGATAAAPATLDDGAPAPAVAKRGRPPKAAEAAPAPAAAPKAAVKPAAVDDGLGDLDDGLGGGAAAEPAVEFNQVLDAFKAFAKNTSRQEAGKILQRFGVTSVNDLPPETWAQALRAVEGG